MILVPSIVITGYKKLSKVIFCNALRLRKSLR